MSMWDPPITDEDLDIILQKTADRDWTGRDEADAVRSLVAEVRRLRAGYEEIEQHVSGSDAYGGLWARAMLDGASPTVTQQSD